MQPGTYWYAMADDGGGAQGFARLGVSAEQGGVTAVDWELRLAFPGGTYEEEREARYDAQGRTLYGAFRHDGGECVVERRGDRFVGHFAPPGKERTAVDRPAPSDAVGGMGFLLAADLPLEVGARREVSDHNDAQGWQPEGRAVLEVEAREPVTVEEGDVDAWRVTLRREDGRLLVLWVDAARRIVRADWGGGMIMSLGSAATRDLFRPPTPTLEAAADDEEDRLALTGLFEGVSPAEMFRWWTEPERLVRWWPQAAEVGAAVGGPYRLAWHEPPWTLLGQITRWQPGTALGFTWAWSHLPQAPEQQVEVLFAPEGGGTRLTILHGRYDPVGHGPAQRADHERGWQASARKLARAIAG